MTEQEAIESLKCYRAQSGTSYPEEIEKAIKALEEIQQYRSIGTQEECQAAMILVKKNKAKKFPIMGSAMIPWEVLEPHEPQAITNHGQTLQKLASRGGLDWGEAAAILEDRRFEKKDMDERKSRDRVLKAVDDFYMIGGNRTWR